MVMHPDYLIEVQPNHAKRDKLCVKLNEQDNTDESISLARRIDPLGQSCETCWVNKSA